MELAALLSIRRGQSDEEILGYLADCGFPAEEVKETVQRLRADNEDPSDND